MEKNVLSYNDTIDGIDVLVEIPYFKDVDGLDEKTVIINDELLTKQNEKNFLRWVLSYCEGIIEGSKDRHIVNFNEMDDDGGLNFVVDNVRIKWLEITKDDKYKVTFEFDFYEIELE